MRDWLLCLVLMFMTACQSEIPPPAHSMQQSDWQTYCSRFVTSDGRVIDEAQHMVTHSEAQAYSMLLATAYADEAMFDRLWQWTKAHLQQRPGDHLLSWLWRQEEQRVLDANNATDADIVAAWALYRAARLWHDEAYREEAGKITASLAGLQRRTIFGEVLRPAAEGFPVDHGMVLNPSYWVFPAFNELAQEDHHLNWQALADSAIKILAHARFGSWQLPPDWLHLADDGSLTPWAARPAVFSYDAIRIPLFLAWAGKKDALTPCHRFWQLFSMQGWAPDRLQLETDEVHLRQDFAVPHAIFLLTEHVLNQAQRWPEVIWYKHINSYEAALQMFCQMAWKQQEGETT